MFCVNCSLHNQEDEIFFIDNNHSISPDILSYYIDIKRKFIKLQKELKNSASNCEASPVIMKEFLNFYFKAETLILILFNEIFQQTFLDRIEAKQPIFQLINKLAKIFISFDLLKLQYPDVFCQFSFYKIYYSDQIHNVLMENEINKIDLLASMVLPMGRLVISIFATSNKEFFYPSILSKRSRIMLFGKRKKVLKLLSHVMIMHNFKYIAFYFGILYNKFFGKKTNNFGKKLNYVTEKYWEMLLECE